MEAQRDPSLNLSGAGREHQTLGGLSAVIVSGDHAELAPGALYGKSPMEAGIRFVNDPARVPNGRRYGVVWVAVGPNGAGGRGINGLVASEMVIDRESRIGYKNLAAHVNDMSAAMSGNVRLDGLAPEEKAALRSVLAEKGGAAWEQAAEAVKESLA